MHHRMMHPSMQHPVMSFPNSATQVPQTPNTPPGCNTGFPFSNPSNPVPHVSSSTTHSSAASFSTQLSLPYGVTIKRRGLVSRKDAQWDGTSGLDGNTGKFDRYVAYLSSTMSQHNTIYLMNTEFIRSVLTISNFIWTSECRYRWGLPAEQIVSDLEWFMGVLETTISNPELPDLLKYSESRNSVLAFYETNIKYGKQGQDPDDLSNNLHQAFMTSFAASGATRLEDYINVLPLQRSRCFGLSLNPTMTAKFSSNSGIMWIVKPFEFLLLQKLITTIHGNMLSMTL